MQYEIKQILNSKSKFPCKITPKEAELLKQVFTMENCFNANQEDKKDIEYRYFLEFENHTYTLIEEYIFRDWETILDINRAIGINYYLYKE